MVEIHEWDWEVPVEREREDDEYGQGDHWVEEHFGPLQNVDAGVAEVCCLDGKFFKF